MSLSEDEMKRIKEEEIYRQEIRAELEKAKPSRITKEKIWAFLNSSFTLLLFSTVIIGSLGWALSTYQNLNKEQSDKIEIQRKLNVEIESRVKETLNALDILKGYVGDKKNFGKSGGCYSPMFVNTTTIELLNGNNSHLLAAVAGGVYSEFEKKGLQGLVSEWQWIVDEKDHSNFEQALSEYDNLRRLALTSKDYDCDGLDKLTEKQKKALLKELEEQKEESLNAIEAAKKGVKDMKQHLASKSIRRGFWWFIGL